MVYVSVPWAAAIAALLVLAGIGKLLNPVQLAQALRELLGVQSVSPLLIRCFAVAECAFGVAVTLASASVPTRTAVGILGLCFLVAGAVGRLRATSEPCGCFGSRGKRSLGLWQVYIGVTFLFWAVLPMIHSRTAGYEVLLSTLIIMVAMRCLQGRRFLTLYFNMASRYGSRN